MPQEVVNLVIGVKDQEGAMSKLESLDSLVDKLNKKKIVLSVDTSSVQAFSKEMEKSVQLATQNINAQARLLKQKNQEMALSIKNQKELNKEAELHAKIALEAQKTQQAIAKSNQEQAKAQAQAEKTRQAIEKTAQAQAEVEAQAQKTAQEQAKVAQQTEKTAQAQAKLATEAQKTATVEERRKLVADQLAAAYEKADLKAQGLSDADAYNPTPMQQRIDNLTGVSNSYKSAAESAKYFMEIEKKVGADTGEKYTGDMSTAGFESYIRSIQGMENATVAATKSIKVGESTFQQFDVSVKKASGDYDNFTFSVDKGTNSVYKAEQGMSSLNKTAGKLSQGLGDMILKFGQWYLVGALVSAPISAFRDAVEELKKVDAELVNIQKVMGATSEEMATLSDKAFEVGSNLGVAASDYLASVTKWAQAGYGSLSDELGELSVKTQKVGDVQEDVANQFLLSVDAAYKYKGNIAELTKVLDGANEISNNYATSVEKLAGGMGIVSSLAAQAGMKVEETMAAIGTITAVTQESGNSAARALRALILNIQGSTEIAIDEETGERWTEDEVEQMAAALGDLNIATREYKNGVEQLRNPMEVIGELSQKYRDGLVSEVQLQEVVSALGGKVRSNQLQALISSYDMYEQMLDTYRESVGSADKELEIYLNSWEAKTNQLKNQWVEFADNMKTSEISMGLLDVANALMDVANTDIGTTIIQVTALAAAVTALAVAYGNYAKAKAQADATEAISNLGRLSKAVGAVKEFGASFLTAGSAIKNAAAAIKGGEGLTAAIKALTVSTGGTLLVVVGAIAAIAILAKGIDVLNVTTQEHLELAEKAKTEYEEATSQLEELNEQLSNNKKSLEELNNAGPLTLTEQADVERLKTENALLETQITLEKERQKLSAQNSFNEYSAAFNKGFSFAGSEYGGNFAPWERTKFSSYDNVGEQIEFIIGQVKTLEQEMQTLGDTEDELNKKEAISEKINNWKELLTVTGGIYTDTLDAATKLLEVDPDNTAAQEFVENYKELTDTIQIFSNSADWTVKKIDELANASQNFASALEGVKSDGVVTTEEVKKLASIFPDLEEIMSKSGITAAELAEHFNAILQSSSDAAGGLDEFGDESGESDEQAKSLSETLSELAGGLKSLSSAQEELDESGKLSLDTVISLMEQYPELENALVSYLAKVTDETELRDILRQKYQEETNDYKLLIVQKMQASSEFYKSVILGNSEVVKKLNELGIKDLENYETLADLKQGVAQQTENQITKIAGEGAKSRAQIFQEEARNFAQTQMNLVAQMRGTQKIEFGPQQNDTPNSGASGNSNSLLSGLGDFSAKIDAIVAEAIADISFDTSNITNTSGGGSSGGGSTKSWYEEQIELLQDYVKQVQDTNTLLEKEDANSAEQRIKNLKEAQDKIHQTANDFRKAGLTDTSDEVKQLKLMWHDLADEIESVYQGMYDDLTEKLADDEWQLDLFKKNRERADRSVEEIAADNAKIVEDYQQMQKEVADLAAYYRSMGYDETDDLIQDLSDAWWDYQEKIESVYDSLTEAFEDYISDSDRQIKELERTTGTAGQQIELYTQRIEEARKSIAELQKTNVNGINDDRIGSIQEQIYSDEDAISGILDDLEKELIAAVDREFDKKQDEIDDAQKEVDRINEILDKYDKQLAEEIEPFEKTIEQAEKDLEDALEPIEDRLEELNDRLDDEKKALEALTDPLNKQIEGYYEVNPDGTVGVYVPGLNDQIKDLQDQLDAENEKWDEQQEREEEALQLQKKELALQEAIKNLEQAQIDLETARDERTVYTLKDGVWAWRANDKTIQEAEDALEDAEQAKEDAEKDLQDYKEEQAHKEIVNLLEDQIEALEKQKEQIEAQIEIYERESQARQDYIQDLIDQAEDEKEAKEDYYNQIIEQNQKEIDARQEYYDNLKAQYDDELEFWETRVDELQKQYDEWAEQWEDIQDAMTGDVRSIEEILADIANYGTPQMKAQIDKVTDLLEQMGVAIGDFNQSMDDMSRPSTGGATSSEQSTIDQMKANAQAWYEAYMRGDTGEMERLEGLNDDLGTGIGASRDNNGVWWDKNGNKLFGDWNPGDGYINSNTSGNNAQPNTSGGPVSGNGSGASSGMTMAQVNDRIEEIRQQAVAASETEKRDLFNEANRLATSKGAQSLAYTPNINDWMWYNSSGDWLFDRGGVARGKGVMLKGVDEPEVVLSPVLASDVLNPVRNDEFMQFADALGIMFSSAHDFAADLRATPPSVSNNNTDSHNVYINGVQIGESMMQKPLSETLSLLGIHRNM